MIVDGCVVVAGTYGDCGTPFDGRCLMSVDVSDWTEEERAAWTEAFPVYGQINVYGVTTKSERHKRSYWTRTADGNGIGGRKAPVPYGS